MQNPLEAGIFNVNSQEKFAKSILSNKVEMPRTEEAARGRADRLLAEFNRMVREFYVQWNQLILLHKATKSFSQSTTDLIRLTIQKEQLWSSILSIIAKLQGDVEELERLVNDSPLPKEIRSDVSKAVDNFKHLYDDFVPQKAEQEQAQHILLEQMLQRCENSLGVAEPSAQEKASWQEMFVSLKKLLIRKLGESNSSVLRRMDSLIEQCS